MTVEEVIFQLTHIADAIHTLLHTISEEQAQWKPVPDTWSIKEVIEHLYNEERLDFRKHLGEMLQVPPQPWGQFRGEEYILAETCRQALKGFVDERAASILWLKGLAAPDWEIKTSTPFSPDGEKISLRAGDVLVSWVAHDFLHLRQLNELLYAWNEKQASPYSVDYAGGW